jgi:hypothetical protein
VLFIFPFDYNCVNAEIIKDHKFKIKGTVQRDGSGLFDRSLLKEEAPWFFRKKSPVPHPVRAL